MKKLLLTTLLMFLACSNPMGVKRDVEVTCKLYSSASTALIYCEGQLVSYLVTKAYEDIIRVPDGSDLTAKLFSSRYTDKPKEIKKTVSDGMIWVIR